jgi:serine/threonine-protein kinase RsbW
MKMSFTLQLPHDALSIPVMRGVLSASLRSVKIDDDCISDIAVALTEACTNVLEHSVDGDEYEVTALIDGWSCAIDVVDTGHGFDAESLGHAEADPTAESGRGIQLMRALVDRVAFVNRPERGTIVHLAKRLVLDDDSPLRQLMLNEQRHAAGEFDGEVSQELFDEREAVLGGDG